MAHTPVLLAPRDIAHLIRRPVGTVTRWASEGRLTSHDGQYDWLELQDVVAGRRRVPPVRRAPAA